MSDAMVEFPGTFCSAVVVPLEYASAVGVVEFDFVGSWMGQ